MEVRILGPLEVLAEGRAVALSGPKPRAVLALLALHADESVSAERLAVALWGEEAPAGAVKAVQVHVSRLRKGLGGTDRVETTAAGYRLCVGGDDVDARRFERHVEAGRGALAAGEPERAARLLGEALALWRGAPLGEFGWAPFAAAETGRLEDLRLEALELRVEADLAVGRAAELVGELQGLTVAHPWRERLHAQLMLAFYRSGRQADALETFRRAREVLVEELGIEPGPELQSLHRAILDQDPGLAGAAPVPRRRGTLPVPPNRTIGRAAEIGAIVDRVRAGGVRLLTLTGPGGVGKTRLALEAARAVEADFADGAGFVRLAAVGRAEDVPGAIMSALSIIPLEGEAPAAAVERFLAVKHLLLVVDNCEHLPGAAPFIGGLVAACPDLTVLATSRETLSVQAEQTRPVPPLALPAGETQPAALADVAAVGLFCERARAHDSGFGLDEGNAAAVAEICRRVDGLPLAIELAAARCGLLSPAEIAERLDAAVGALGAAPRDAPARQRTLRATVDWSHELLSAEEQACFARFAVFSGGATVRAAEAITGARLDTLDRLVAKSLLVRREVDGRTRLGMLETIRAFAAERLGALADSDTVRERHYRFYLALAQRHGSDQALVATSRKEHLSRLDAETGNFAAALEWAAAQDATAPLLDLCAALVIHWFFRQRYAHVVEWIERALSRPDGDPALRAQCLITMSGALWALGRKAEQRPVEEEADTLTATLPGTSIRALVLRERALKEAWDGRLDLARALADRAEACARTTGDPWEIAVAAYARALAAGDRLELHARVDRAASLLEQTGDAYHLADLFYRAGYRALWSGSHDDAAEFLARAVALTRELDDPFELMLVQARWGLAALLRDDIASAAAAFREQLDLARELVVFPVAFEALRGLAAVAARDGDFDRAARLYGAAGAHRYEEPEHPIDTRLYDTFFAPALARHGTEAWDTAERAGATLGLRDAIAYALDERQPQAAVDPLAKSR
jgi:predicted ATPase/DNA-binding SARP family transcriptional activator